MSLAVKDYHTAIEAELDTHKVPQQTLLNAESLKDDLRKIPER